MSFFGSGATTAVGNSNNTSTGEKDIEVADPPPDSISSIAFSGQANYLAVGSWDNSVRTLDIVIGASLNHSQVRIYEVGAGGQTQGKAMYQHQGPVMSVCWNKVWRTLDAADPGCSFLSPYRRGTR